MDFPKQSAASIIAQYRAFRRHIATAAQLGYHASSGDEAPT
jgi:hypothetical protein